jgi:hypothetical protein
LAVLGDLEVVAKILGARALIGGLARDCQARVEGSPRRAQVLVVPRLAEQEEVRPMRALQVEGALVRVLLALRPLLGPLGLASVVVRAPAARIGRLDDEDGGEAEDIDHGASS